MPCKSGLEEEWNPTPKERFYSEMADDYIKKSRIAEKLNEKLLNLKSTKKSIESIEDVAFNSFMTVWLCKAMSLLDSKGILHFMTSDARWWYDEHQYRDANLNASRLTHKELAEKLTTIINNHKVE
jgi:hypothetical protein